MLKPEGKNILITGAASGIGKLLAEMMAEAGGNLILLDINEEGLNRFKEKYKGENIHIWTYRVDLTSREEIERVAKEIKRDTGNRVDIIVNNAGIVTGKPFIESSTDEIEKSFRINTLAHFWIVKAFIDEMVKRNSGHIVTIASAAGIIGVKKLSDYCAAKFAVFGFTESLRMEFKMDNIDIKTTIVAPFYIDTGMFKGVKSKVPWLLPIMKPEDAVRKIFKAIIKEKPLLLLPPVVKSVWFFRLLSVRILDWAANLLGINNTMDEFVGRNGTEGR